MFSEDLQQEFSQNFLDYAASVNWDRAIPRAQDGLKPVARRILWGMYEGKYFSNKPEVKSARIVGDVMGKYHPHGDSSIYEAMIRLSKEWIMRYPLIDVHGNKGNVGGDGPAAMRYTESRLNALVEDSCLGSLKKDVVDMQPNYDDTLQEPEVLPSIFPNLLCSPNQGIGVAQACYWMPHNLKDIGNKIISYIQTNTINYDDLYPDFPLGGTIVNKDEVAKIYQTGKGKVVVEGKYKIENNQIIFYEQPYEVSTESLIEKLKEKYDAGKLTQIADFQDQSGKKGFRLVFDLIPNANQELALTEIFSYSDLRKSYSANHVAIRDMKKGPELLTLQNIFDCYIEHNTACIRREFDYDYGRARKRILILEGLLKAINKLDLVIRIIRQGDNPKQELIEQIELNEEQAQAVLDMKLGRLSKLENEKLEKELQEKKEYAAYCEFIVNSEDKQKEILIDRLQELVKKYGDERRTEVIQKDIKKISAGKAKEKIEEVPQDIVVIFDNNGYIKAVPVAQYKKPKNMIITSEFKCTTKDLILLFSSLGKCYRISAKDIGLSAANDKGKIITTIVQTEKNERIIKVLPNIVDDKHPFVTIITNDGKIKKTDKVDLIGTTRNLRGIKYIGLDNNEVFYVAETNGDYIHIGTTDGYNIAFELNDIRPTGKTSKGVIAIKLNEGAKINACGLNIKPKGIEITKRASKGKKI